jgi:hypothetical protein
MRGDDDEDIPVEDAPAPPRQQVLGFSAGVPRILDLADGARPVDWRWYWAKQLAGRKLGRRERKSLDRHLAGAIKFIRQLDKCDRAGLILVAYERLAHKMPAFYTAYFWHTAFDRGLRSLLEAYLLSGLAPAAAAARCGLSPEAGEAYAALFFDVCDRLDNKGFIIAQVLGSSAAVKVSAGDYPTLWRLLGYTRGHLFLDAMCLRDSVGKHVANMDEVHRARRAAVLDFFGAASMRAGLALDPFADGGTVANAYAKLLRVPAAAGESPVAAAPVARPTVVSVMDVLRGGAGGGGERLRAAARAVPADGIAGAAGAETPAGVGAAGAANPPA